MSKNTFYITTAIPYVNAKPHLGHVLEWFQADAIARYQRLLGKEVQFASGADENSLKNVQAAEKAQVEPQAWLDEYSQIFKDAYDFFNISLTAFRRGSDQSLHWPGVQELWNKCVQAGDMYTKTYTGLYCVGCEAFYTPDELVDGKCPEHLTKPEEVKEENYFFKLSKYQDQILKLIETNELKISSDQYRNEMLGFVKQGLEDFSVSRSAERGRGVGVPVPNDPSQVMYVWFDALTIYMTAMGWGYDRPNWEKWWPADIHFIGKGINRFHSIYWIGMLLSAGLPTPKQVSVHGYITVDNQKMSKSLGNVIDPYELVTKYGLEPVRYYLLKEIPSHGDGDFSYQRFFETYTADLANGLGNLCSRVAKLAEKNNITGITPPTSFNPTFQAYLDEIEIDQALKWIVSLIATTDQYLSTEKPWQLTGESQKMVLEKAITSIQEIAYHLQPFMPTTAQKILDHFSGNSITSLAPLFPRLEAA
jgi:methionyl-tRNA synthetase